MPDVVIGAHLCRASANSLADPGRVASGAKAYTAVMATSTVTLCGMRRNWAESSPTCWETP